MRDLAARVRLAEAYPYERPRHSYLFVDAGVWPLQEPPSSERVAVIAAGSNAAPERLAAKFTGWSAEVPVTRAALDDHAVVYAAHFASYGAMPATLHPAPGAKSEVFVTWLTAAQLVHMHTTEGIGLRYDSVERSGLRLAAVPGASCAFTACAQMAILRLTHRRLARQHSYVTFISQVIASADYRHGASTTLARTAARWSGTED